MQQNYQDEFAYNQRCARAIESLKLFMADAKNQLKSNIDLSTLELIISTVDGPKKPHQVMWDNVPEEKAYES